MTQNRPGPIEAARRHRTRFLRDESGAVTIDWVVLTATIVFMGLAAAFYVASSAPIVAEKTGDYLSNVEVGAAN